MIFHGFIAELAYNLTADAVKKQKGLQTRVYIQASDPVSQVMENIKLSSNKESCKHYFVIVKVSLTNFASYWDQLCSSKILCWSS